MSRVERHARNVDKAATKTLPRLHAHTVKLEEHYDVPIPMKKKAALENFYMVKEAFADPLTLAGLTVLGAGSAYGYGRAKDYMARKRGSKKAVTPAPARKNYPWFGRDPKSKGATAPVQTPKSEIRGKGTFKSRRMSKGKAALLATAGGLATGLLANEAYKKYKKSRN